MLLCVCCHSPPHNSMLAQGTAYARVGILGNPSDGYGGRGLSSTIRNYSATAVVLLSASGLTVGSLSLAGDLRQVEAYVRQNGYPVEAGDGTNLLLATVVVFVQAAGLRLPPAPHGLSLQVSTTVPRQVGLAGSSAICTAVFRALMAWSGVSFPPAVVAREVFLAESRELGIACGMQDRVAQAFDCSVEMDFAVDKYTCVEPVLAHQHWFLLFPPSKTTTTDLAKTSGGVHLPVKQRWLNGDAEVVSKMQSIAALVPLGIQCLADKDWRGLAALMNRNFDLRLDLFGLGRGVAVRDYEAIQLARSYPGGGVVGCKLPGSGGCVLALVVDCVNPQAFVDYVDQHGGVRAERIIPPTRV